MSLLLIGRMIGFTGDAPCHHGHGNHNQRPCRHRQRIIGRSAHQPQRPYRSFGRAWPRRGYVDANEPLRRGERIMKINTYLQSGSERGPLPGGRHETGDTPLAGDQMLGEKQLNVRAVDSVHFSQLRDSVLLGQRLCTA